MDIPIGHHSYKWKMGGQGIVELHAYQLLQLFAFFLLNSKITKKAGKLMNQPRINGF
ncbi:MAG: hypothetical protein RJB31_1452 [Bacteroidota bacterium]